MKWKQTMFDMSSSENKSNDYKIRDKIRNDNSNGRRKSSCETGRNKKEAE